MTFKSLSDDKIIDLTKWQAFADGELNVLLNKKRVYGRLEKKMGKREHAGYQHFLLFAKCFQVVPFQGC